MKNLRKIGLLLVIAMIVSLMLPVSSVFAVGGLVTVNDSERDWVSDEYFISPGNYWDQQDPVRLVTNRGEEPWKQMRPEEEDSDNLSFSWFVYINAVVDREGVPTPVRDQQLEQSLYKYLPEPLMGGSFSFWVHNSNPDYLQQPLNAGFGLEAIAYDEEGTAYSLGQETFEGLGMQTGWNYYENDMPSDVVVVKMEIKMFAIPEFVVPEGYIQEMKNWFCNVDDIKFTDTTIAADVVFDEEDPSTWEIDYGVIDQLSELNRPQFRLRGDSALDFLADFAMNGNPGSTVTLKKDYPTGIKGGSFSLKIFNASHNPRNPENPLTSLKVVATLFDDTKVELGEFTDTEGYIEYGGYPVQNRIFFGYRYCEFDMPADRSVKTIEIVFSENTEAQVTANYFMDEIKFVGTTFDAGDDTLSDSESSTSDTSSTPDESSVPDETEEPGDGFNSILILMILALSAFAGIMISTKIIKAKRGM